jgi:hypothetical protein
VHVIQVISRLSGGNLGPVTYKRGMVVLLVGCPLGCGLQINKEDIQQHESVCELRGVLCVACDTTVFACDFDEHTSESCSRRPVICSECKEPYPFNEEDAHKSSTCAMRLQPCPNSCGELRALPDVHLHLPHCTWRLVSCRLKCIEHIKLKDRFNHEKFDCTNRRVECTMDCGNLVMAKDVLYHMREICPHRPAVCNWCGESVRFLNKKRHERDCYQRRYPCPYKCGEDVSKDTEDRHFASDCRFRFVDCCNVCDLRQVRVCDLDKHLSFQCELRIVPCPMGCIDERTAVVTRMRYQLLDIHVRSECVERTVRCSACLQEMSAKTMEIHGRLECPAREVRCRLDGCIKVLPLVDRERHERFECRFRVTLCPNACGESLQLSHMGRHRLKHCVRRLVDCSLGCGVPVRHCQLEEHLHGDCKNRVLSEAALRAIKYGGKLI